MKKIIVVSDSFKGTISSSEICRVACESVPRFFPEAQLQTIPIADGGEGTVDCFIQAIGAHPVSVPVSGPFGETVIAVYARKDSLAIIEAASAVGLPMATGRENPARASTYGVGQQIRHAVENGCTEIILGLGGSCSNDGGCGVAAALGVVFEDDHGCSFVPVGETLHCISRIHCEKSKAFLQGVSITVMCDVENPLYGPNGAAYIFAPQKGANSAMVKMLDQELRSFADTLERECLFSGSSLPGAGAAGGMGAGCMALLGATLKSGIDTILDAVNFDLALENCDCVITGEGKIDSQSIRGKAVSGIAKRTFAKHIPLIAIVGSIDESAASAYDVGVTAMFGIDRSAQAFFEYAEKSCIYYQRTLEDILRLLRAFSLPP